MKPISIIILNWNGSKDTIECIKSLKKLEYRNINLIVVDNGSTDDSVNKIKAEIVENAENKSFSNLVEISFKEIDSKINYKEKKPIESITIIKNEGNLGFAKGNNIGIKHALKQGAEYVLLLNNDTIVEPDFLTKIISFVNKNQDYVAITPKICLADPNNVIWNCGGKLTWFGNRKYFYAGKDDKDTPQNGYKRITFITGCALFFKPMVTGKLTEKFFFGEEDFEFSMRLKRDKQKMACVFDSKIYHKVGNTFKNNNNAKYSRVYIHYLCRFIDLKFYYSKPIWFFLLILNSIYVFFMLNLKYKITIKSALKMLNMIFKNAFKMNEFNKKDFDIAKTKKF